MEYLDFDIRVSKASGLDYPISVVRPPAGGEVSDVMKFPFDELELKYQLRGVDLAVSRSGRLSRDVSVDAPEIQELNVFGEKLFSALFTPDVQTAFRRCQDHARSLRKGLRVRLRVDAPELSSLPWEFMYDPDERDYMCLSRDTPLIRYLELPQTAAALSIPPPLSILAMTASPSDRPKLDSAREQQRMQEATAGMQKAGLLRIDWLEGSTWRDLQKALRRGPYHVFHFVGHGGFDNAAGEGMLAFTDDAGKTALLGATEVGRLLHDHDSLRLVVLNSCLGAKGNESDVFSSTSATLVGRGLPAVVAMQYEISDSAAIEFSRSLYEALADGLPIDASVAEARKAVSIASKNSVEWGTPVLHMRSPDGVLFRIEGTTTTEAVTTGAYIRVPRFAKTAARSTDSVEAAAAKPAPAPALQPTATPVRQAVAVAPAIADSAPVRNESGATPATLGSRKWLLLSAGALVAVLGAVFGWKFMTSAIAPSDIQLIAPADTVVEGQAAPVAFRLLIDERGVLGPAANQALAQRGDRAVLFTRTGNDRGDVIAADDSGRFPLSRLKRGTTAMWPAVVHGDSTILEWRLQHPVKVVSPKEAQEVAAAELAKAVASLTTDTVSSDAALIEQLQHISKEHGGHMEPEDQNALSEVTARLHRLTGLRTGAYASADTVTVQERMAAVRLYVDSAKSLRGARYPTAAADAESLKALDAALVGTVLTVGVCPAKCESGTRRDTLFAVGANVGLMIRYVRGSSGALVVEWRRAGLNPTTKPYTAEQYSAAGYRIWDQKAVGESGRWDVRVLNARRQLVFRHAFNVR